MRIAFQLKVIGTFRKRKLKKKGGPDLRQCSKQRSVYLCHPSFPPPVSCSSYSCSCYSCSCLLLLLLPPASAAPASCSCSCSWPESQHLLASTSSRPLSLSSLSDLSQTTPKRKSTRKEEMLNEWTWSLVQAFIQKYKIAIELGKTNHGGHGADCILVAFLFAC